MNEPFNAKIFYANVFAILVMYTFADKPEEVIYPLALLFLIYILQVLCKVFNLLMRIANYLEKIKDLR